MQGIYGPDDADPVYLEGLRDSVSVGLDYALEAIERGEERAPPPPPALLAQARMAARSGVGLDTVLRRYLAAYTLLGELLADEAQKSLTGSLTPADLLPGRAALFDRLIAAVAEDYEREAAIRSSSSERRRADRVERLLAGERLETSGLGYDLNAHHTGMVGVGLGVAETIRQLASALDRRLLIVPREQGAVWAWLGGRRPIATREVTDRLAAEPREGTALALGEPAEGVDGWRFSHRQAAAALPIAMRIDRRVARYADTALLAAALSDDLLATSLWRFYLLPFMELGDRRDVLLGTLRTYFRANGNVSSAAAALGVTRRTVSKRLRAAEAVLGRSLHEVEVDLKLTLRLDELWSAGDGREAQRGNRRPPTSTTLDIRRGCGGGRVM